MEAGDFIFHLNCFSLPFVTLRSRGGHSAVLLAHGFYCWRPCFPLSAVALVAQFILWPDASTPGIKTIGKLWGWKRSTSFPVCSRFLIFLTRVIWKRPGGGFPRRSSNWPKQFAGFHMV